MGIFKQNIIMINIVLFGKPGAGKGTQAEFLKIKYNLIHISTGDLFRNNITEKTTLGILAKSYMDKGNLVPDQVTIDMLEAEVDKKVNDDGKIKTLKDFSIKELNKKLTNSIAEENYEFAARVRDEIKRRN